MDKTEIIPARLSDLDRITEIYSHAVLNGTASYELESPSRAEMEIRFRQLSDNGYPWLTAIRGASVLGYAYAGPFRPRRAYRFMVEDTIYVAPDAQGLGIGRKLLDALITEAEKLGFRQMVAVIGDGSRNIASVNLHESAGFQHSGKIIGSGFKHDLWLDTIFMQRSLNGGNAIPPDPESLPERNFRNGL